MRVSQIAKRPCQVSSGRLAAALIVLLGLMAAVVALPCSAPAGQSSQATSSPVAQVAAGLYHSCALIDDGTTPAPPGRPVRCWGFNGNGQLGYGNRITIGDNETPDTAGPVNLGAGRTAKALANGDYHTCAVLDNGTVRCWGYGNEGQVGLGNRSDVGDNETPGSVGPVSLGAGRTATAITAGGNHSCAVLDNGVVRCWGLGEYGQLGNGGTGSIGDSEDPGLANPVNLGGGHIATAVTAGAFHTCAIRGDGAVKCWGLGGNGQLGLAASAAVLDPSQVGTVDLGPGRTAKAITAGFGHTCAILDNGSVRCWGLNEVGQLGYGNTSQIGDNEAPALAGPVNLGPGRTATAISAGGDKTCAVLDDGSLRCWGRGLYGQLGSLGVTPIGDNETPASVAPVDLGPGRKAVAVAAGIFHTCARIDDGSVRCWGNGTVAQLGLCRLTDIGDDETPGSVGQVNLGDGGAACPSSPPPAKPVSGGVRYIPPPVAGLSADEKALRAEKDRTQGLRDCLAAVRGRARKALRSARRKHRRGTRARALAVRRAARRAARGRARCKRRFGRTPGRVTMLDAKATSGGRITLTFRAAGTDGSSPPPARSYVIKQSTRPMRSRRAFRRAQALCKRRVCRFPVNRSRASITLNVTNLRPNRTYYYAVAARDNVSGRLGPRETVRAKTR